MSTVSMSTSKEVSSLAMKFATLSPDTPSEEVTEYMPTGLPEEAKERIRLTAAMTKELRLRDGCKNLLKAIPKNPKNIQRRNELKAQLARLQKNISKIMRRIQKLNWAESRPEFAKIGTYSMLSLAQKTTTKLDLTENLNLFIESHYHEVPEKFKDEVNTLQEARDDFRRATATPEGKATALRYYQYLNQADHRFFQEDKCLDTVFTWFDVFEGHPVAKKSLKLEKASVLFNVAAICTQIAQQQDCTTEDGLEAATKEYESAAGILQFIREDSALKCSIATDLARSSLSTLSTMMLAQAQECIWYKLLLNGKTEDANWQPSGTEAAAVSEWYSSARESFKQPLSSGVPRQWLDMVCLKEMYYRGIASWYAGIEDMGSQTKMKKVAGIAKVYRSSIDLKQCQTKWAKMLPGELEFAGQINEHVGLADQVLNHISTEILDGISKKMDQMPPITGKAVKWATASCEEVTTVQDEDLFAAFGPVYFFNSMCALVERRTHTVTFDSSGVGFGFSLSGGNPVRVYDVQYEGPASKAGILAGDYIIQVADKDVRCLVSTQLEEVLAEHAKAGEPVEIGVVVNYDMQNFEELINPEVPQSPTSITTTAPMPTGWVPTRQNSTFRINGRGPSNVEEPE